MYHYHYYYYYYHYIDIIIIIVTKLSQPELPKGFSTTCTTCFCDKFFHAPHVTFWNIPNPPGDRPKRIIRLLRTTFA